MSNIDQIREQLRECLNLAQRYKDMYLKLRDESTYDKVRILRLEEEIDRLVESQHQSYDKVKPSPRNSG